MFDKTELEKTGECIELVFSSNWNYISITRQFIQNFLAISSGDREKADKFSISISELLENAVKYSTDDRPYMFLHVNEKTQEILGVVENYATKEAADTLQELYNTVMEGTPMEAYVSQMKKAATLDDGTCQLGLARIRFEAGADIKLVISDDYKITLMIIIK